MPWRRRPRPIASASTTSSSTTSTRTVALPSTPRPGEVDPPGGRHAPAVRGSEAPPLAAPRTSGPAGVTRVRRPMSHPHKATTIRRRYPPPARPVHDRGARRPDPPRGRTPRAVGNNQEECPMHAHGDRAGPARPPRRRRGRPYLAGPHLAALVGVLALTLAVAACGGAKTNGVASLNSATQTTNAGGLAVGPQTRVKPDDPKFKAAQQACQKLLPNAGKGGTVANSGGGK